MKNKNQNITLNLFHKLIKKILPLLISRKRPCKSDVLFVDKNFD